jgi:hypothetical protein
LIEIKFNTRPTPRVDDFPALGIDATGVVVLFNGYQSGFVLTGGFDTPVGYYSDCWNMDDFFLMNGEITLRNT